MAGLGAVNHHPHDPANRFAANLDVKNLEAEAGGDTARGRSHPLTHVISARRHQRSPGVFDVGRPGTGARARRSPLKSK